MMNRMKMSTFFLFCRNIFFPPFSTVFRKQQKILACFPEDKLCTIDIDLQIQKVFTDALNASYFLPEHQWMFEPFLIVMLESLNCPQCEKMDLKIIQSLLKRVQICKRCWKTEESAGHGGFSEEQCSGYLFRTNKGLMNNHHKTKKLLWIIQVTTHSIKNQGFPNGWMGLMC